MNKPLTPDFRRRLAPRHQVLFAPLDAGPEAWALPNHDSGEMGTPTPDDRGALPPPVARLRPRPQRPLDKRITVLRRRTINVGVLTSSPMTEVPLLPWVGTEAWTSGLLFVRLHTKTLFPPNVELRVLAYPASRTAADPAQTFVGTKQLALVALTAASTNGTLGMEGFTPADGTRVVIQVAPTGGAVVGQVRVALSVELVGRFG